MKRQWKVLAAAVLVVGMGSTAQAVDLLGYYTLEGNLNDSATPANNATSTITQGSGFVAGGFRGQGFNFNPGGAGGGDKIDLPFDAGPASIPSVTFGGWINVDAGANFDGFMSTDNGGWDRGIALNQGGGNEWKITSGNPSPSNSANNAVTPGQWQYVVGTFDGTNRILYYGDDVAGNQTTLTLTGPDNAPFGATGNEPTIEVGRFDNQDLDGQVDDLFVFDAALTADQANAIRNLRLNPTLDYSPADSELLFDLFDAGTGFVLIDGYYWSNTSGLAGTPGQLSQTGDDFDLVLNSQTGAGLTASTPEPTTIAIWSILGVVGFGYAWRLKKRAK